MNTDQINQQLHTLIIEARQTPTGDDREMIKALIEACRRELQSLGEFTKGNGAIDGFTLMEQYILHGHSISTIAKDYELLQPYWHDKIRQQLKGFKDDCLNILLDTQGKTSQRKVQIKAFKSYRRQRSQVLEIQSLYEEAIAPKPHQQDAFADRLMWCLENLDQYDSARGTPLHWFRSGYYPPSSPSSNKDKDEHDQSNLFHDSEIGITFSDWVEERRERLRQIFVAECRDHLNAYTLLKMVAEFIRGEKDLSEIFEEISQRCSINPEIIEEFFEDFCKSILWEYALYTKQVGWLYNSRIREQLHKYKAKLEKKKMAGKSINAYALINLMLFEGKSLEDVAEAHNLNILKLQKFWNKSCFPFVERLGNDVKKVMEEERLTFTSLTRIEIQAWVTWNRDDLSQISAPQYPEVNAYDLIINHLFSGDPLFPRYQSWPGILHFYHNNVPQGILEEFYQEECLPFLREASSLFQSKTARSVIRTHQDAFLNFYWTECPSDVVPEQQAINALVLLRQRLVHWGTIRTGIVNRGKDWDRIIDELKLNREYYFRFGNQREMRKILDKDKLELIRLGLITFYAERVLPAFFQQIEPM